MLSRKVMTIHLITRLIKKISFHKMSYHSEPDSHSRIEVKVKLDLPNYATISNVKKATNNMSNLAIKKDLSGLKA